MTPFFRRPFRYAFFSATYIIIAINIFVFIFTSIDRRLSYFLGLNPAFFLYGKMYWQPVTYMFTHSSFQHILFNMLGLLFFATPLERKIGSKEFLLLYLLCGTLSGLFSLAVYIFFNMNILLVGASGAVFAIMLAFAVLFPRTQLFIWGILPVPAPIMVLIYTIIEFLSQFSRTDNVAHMTHLAGFAFSWLYLTIRMGLNPLKVWKDVYKA